MKTETTAIVTAKEKRKYDTEYSRSIIVGMIYTNKYGSVAQA